MGPNNAELVRVYTREKDALIADITFPYTLTFEAVIDCEAGTAIHDAGARYEIKINLVDFSTMRAIIKSAIVAEGHLRDASWPEQAQQFVFLLPAPGALNEGHICKIFASLKVGIANPYTSLAESPLFLITTP